MREHLLIDTNTVLDMAMQDRPGHEFALMLLDEIEMHEVEAILCATSLKDIYYVLTRYMGEEDARTYVGALLKVFSIATIDSAICTQSFLSSEPDFEDGLVRACAENERVSYIISRDKKAFAKSFVKSLTPQEYIELKGNWQQIDA